MFIAVLLITKGRNHHTSVKEGMDKLWYMHTGEYYSSLTREGILTHTTIWRCLEDLMLSETSQSQMHMMCFE
jgi:hypothetical protein